MLINEIIGAVVAVLIVGLIGVVYERGTRIAILYKQLLESEISATNSRKAEADLRTVIEHYNGRPFQITFSEDQIVNLAGMILTAMTRATDKSRLN